MTVPGPMPSPCEGDMMCQYNDGCNGKVTHRATQRPGFSLCSRHARAWDKWSATGDKVKPLTRETETDEATRCREEL